MYIYLFFSFKKKYIPIIPINFIIRYLSKLYLFYSFILY